MKELDFDELDRAVNSLMTDVPKTNVPQEDEVKTLTITPSSSATPITSPTPIISNPAEEVNVTTTPSVPVRTSTPPPLAMRRGGRFMDVVHPSSDMKKAESPRPVSRQGTTITQRGSSALPVESTNPPSVVEPKKSETPSPASVGEWPDPLELADFKDDLVANAVDSMPDQLDKSETNSEVFEETSPLTSPFLPGTKVDKRPLGGSTAVVEDMPSPESNLGSGKDKLTVNNPDDQLPATPQREVEPTLPEELRGDLVAIESGTARGSSNNHEEETNKTSAPKPPVALLEEPVAEAKEQPAVPTGPVSIPQQYREEPSTGESVNGSIYDTDTYHQPLAHPTKKKTGWLWVVWIVLILAVGAGIGAALYSFKII